MFRLAAEPKRWISVTVPSGAETDKPTAERPEERGSLGYTVDAPPGSGERAVGIEGERRAGTTRLIFTFRLGQRP